MEIQEDITYTIPIYVRLGTVDGHEVTFQMGFAPDGPEVSDLKDAPEPDKMSAEGYANYKWVNSLDKKHQPYFYFLLHADRLWQAQSGSEHPPVWVHCDGHPNLEDALSKHFGVRGNKVEIVNADERHKRFAAAVAKGVRA